MSVKGEPLTVVENRHLIRPYLPATNYIEIASFHNGTHAISCCFHRFNISNLLGQQIEGVDFIGDLGEV